MFARKYLAVLAVALLVGTIQAVHAQLPAGWTDADIGSCAYAGSATYNSTSGAFTVNGSGKLLGAPPDAFNFCYQAYTGNFTLIARVTSNSSGGYVGLEVRESLATNARAHFTQLFPPSSNQSMVWARERITTGGTAIVYSGPTMTFPIWLKTVRAGSCIYTYTSSDAVHWYDLQQDNLPGLASTVYAGLAVSALNNAALQTAVFDNVSIAPATSGDTVPGTVTSSWIGNTYGNGPSLQQCQYTISGMYVAPDGTCFANHWALEVAREWGVYKGGTSVNFIADGANAGGAAVAGDSNYIYLAQQITSDGPATGTYYAIGRVSNSSANGYPAAPFTGGYGSLGNMLVIGAKAATQCPGNVWGLACNSATSTLYASDTINGKIDVISTATMAITSSWTLPSGDQPYALAWDGTDSLLWVVVQNTATGVRQIWAYNTSGVQQTVSTITAPVNPVSIAYYINHLYVADNGPDQDIKVYQSLTTNPTLWIYYGAVGGSFSGTNATVGTMGSWRLNGLTAIGIDSTGNIYVACNGHGPDLNEDDTYRDMRYGGTLESYNLGSRALNWRMQGFEFVDNACIDPTNETSAYGATVHYNLNFSNTTPGTEWSGYGNTLNFWKYPTDPRLFQSNTSYETQQLCYISGKKFLVVGDDYVTTFYRFSSTTGETAIPCAQFNMSGSYGTGTLTSTSNYSNGDTVTVGATTYTFVTALSTSPTVPDQVLIGANDTLSDANLDAAIDASTEIGVNYSVGTVANTAASALDSLHTVSLTAKSGGTAGNSVATTSVTTHASFGSSTLTGGVNGLYIWTDANGDGIQQSSEVVYPGTYVNPLNALYIDTNGTLWSTNGATVIKFPCTVSSGGVPQYSYSTHVSTNFSALGTLSNDHLTAGNRMEYDASSDTMYILGFSTNYPSTASVSGAGSVVMCYTTWSSTPVLAWESVLPIVTTGNDQTSFVIEAMAGAGKYLFLQFEQGEETLVLSKATGAQVGTMYPDPTVIGAFGWCDYTHSVSAFERSNGEYIITLEDDVYNKAIMYRWTGAP